MEDAAKIGNKAYLHSNGSLTIAGGHFLIAGRLDECPEMMEIGDNMIDNKVSKRNKGDNMIDNKVSKRNKGVPLNHNERHHTCFNCGNMTEEPLTVFLKVNPVVLNGKIHHRYCCNRCFKLLTEVMLRYKRRDFVYKREDKHG